MAVPGREKAQANQYHQCIIKDFVGAKEEECTHKALNSRKIQTKGFDPYNQEKISAGGISIV